MPCDGTQGLRRKGSLQVGKYLALWTPFHWVRAGDWELELQIPREEPEGLQIANRGPGSNIIKNGLAVLVASWTGIGKVTALTALSDRGR